MHLSLLFENYRSTVVVAVQIESDTMMHEITAAHGPHLLHLTGIALYKLLEWKRLEPQVRWIGVAISLAGVGLVFI